MSRKRASMREVPMFAGLGDPALIERLRRAHLVDALFVEDNLGDKIELALADGVPKTVPEIAAFPFVRRRRDVVKNALVADARFVRVAAPPGKSSRGKTWTLAPPAVGRAGTSSSDDESAAA